MKVKVRYFIIGFLVIFVGYFAITSLQPAEGKYDEFAMCLSEHKVTMYGAYWCPHCANQKEMFGPSFKYVPYVECDPSGDNANPQACEEKGVTGYPTWIFGADKFEGEMTLQKISEVSGCKIES